MSEMDNRIVTGLREAAAGDTGRVTRPGEMIGRIARVLEPQAWEALAAKDSLSYQGRRTSSLRKSRKVLDAMREPTTEMLRGLLRHRGYDPDAKEETLDALGQLDVAAMGALVGNYKAMITAALSEKP